MVNDLQTVNITIKSLKVIYSLMQFLQIACTGTFIFDGNWFIRILLNAVLARSAVCRLASTAEASSEIISILSDGDH